jgi:hypothetical protein
VSLHGDGEEPSQHAAPVRLPRCSMEEVGSSSARGRKPYTRARPKLADSSDARHGEAEFFSSTRRNKRSTRIEVSPDSSSDDPRRRVVLVDLTHPVTNLATILKTMRQVLKPSCTICPCTFTSSLINCSNASICIWCRKLLHMTLTGFALKSTSSRNQLKRSMQVLKPELKQLSCKLQLL